MGKDPTDGAQHSAVVPWKLSLQPEDLGEVVLAAEAVDMAQQDAEPRFSHL